MARKLELAKANADQVNGGGEFSYGELMIAVLRAAPRGVTIDEMSEILAVIEPIERAMIRGQATVALSDEQWGVLREKLARFPFNFVDRAVWRFGQHIREAPEIGGETLSVPARMNGPVGINGPVEARLDG